jgi:hypothetical protein
MSCSFITGYEDAHFQRRSNVESWTLDGKSVSFPEGMRYPNEMLNTA